ncbi:hypothetical protein DN53_04755 [Flagellimonas olearia]|uniref:Uncharacterized protein n=1 Tax=Flagellimonas olearia TaxID=552546 RepID=A0A444VRT5_9FLAO|nr:hypothetical protein DN53_04755 [Allomuricauda olearia]
MANGNGSGVSQGTSIILSPPKFGFPYSIWVFVQSSSLEQEANRNASGTSNRGLDDFTGS